MSMYGRDPWGGPLEISQLDSATDDDRSRDLDRAALSTSSLRPPLDETQQSWLLAAPDDPASSRRKKYVDLGCVIVSRKLFIYALSAAAAILAVAGIVTLIAKTIPKHHPRPPPADNYTLALHKALMFFNAQRSGALPRHNNVSWRGNSGMKDGMSDPGVRRNLVGGFYDAGDAIKFSFPQSFAMTMLSWSVIEYGKKYEAVGELEHVREIIKWGANYLLKTFNSSADSIDQLVAQVGQGGASGGPLPNDHYCWVRPEDIDYPRPVLECHACSDLAAEMAAALAAASIVFKDDKSYSKKLVHGATTLFKFSRDQRGRYSAGNADPSRFYNSTGYWDEFVWGGTWMYLATGNSSYLTLATHPTMAKHAGAFWGGPDYGVFSWDNKLAGAQLEACAHPFFDELREPNARLPNGRPLPPLFNFKQEVLYGDVFDYSAAGMILNVFIKARLLFKDWKMFPQMADPVLHGHFPMRALYQALAVAAMCVQEQPTMRPQINPQ